MRWGGSALPLKYRRKCRRTGNVENSYRILLFFTWETNDIRYSDYRNVGYRMILNYSQQLGVYPSLACNLSHRTSL